MIKYLIITTALVIFLSTFLFLSFNITNVKKEVREELFDFKVEVIKSGCSSNRESKIEEVKFFNNSMEIILLISNLPNPCYGINGNLSLDNSDINIFLSLYGKEGFCIMCIGEILTKIRIDGLENRKYNLNIFLNGKRLFLLPS